MTGTAWALLAGAFVLAVVDWVGCASRRRHLRHLGKPGALVLLLATALALHPAHELQRDIFLGALLLSLAGDIFLLLPERWFVPGLGAFLLAHIAYSAGFAVAGPQLPRLALALPAVGIASLLIGRRILKGVRAGKPSVSSSAVAGYLIAISVMVVLAAATGNPAALAGALLFYLSDAMIAWNRFVEPQPRTSLPVIITYHLAQGLLVLSLL